MTGGHQALYNVSVQMGGWSVSQLVGWSVGQLVDSASNYPTA